MGKVEKFIFTRLPQDASELQAMAEGELKTPYQTAALTVAALCRYGDNPEKAIEMLNYLKGPQPLTKQDSQFLRDRLAGKSYKPYSFFEGATPANNYTPNQPYTITISSGPYSFQEEGYAKLILTSSGADSPRQVKLRVKPSSGQWFLWEQYLLPDIREPAGASSWQ